MHRPFATSTWATTATTTAATTVMPANARDAALGPSLRRVLRSWRRPSSLRAGLFSASRATLVLMQITLAQLVRRRDDNDGDDLRTQFSAPHGIAAGGLSRPTPRPGLHTRARLSAAGAGLRRGVCGPAWGLHTSPACATTSTSATAAAASSAFVCARRWASMGRRPTYQEISEALNILKVDIGIEAGPLKKRYRELVKAHHPDAGGDEKTMAQITVAYERLESLSKREKEEFLLQKKMYGGSSGGSNPYQARATYTGRRGGHPFGYAYGNTGGSADNDPFRNGAGASGHYYQGADPFADARAQQQSYWNYYNRQKSAGGTNFTENPFSSSNPFSMYSQMRRARFMPSGTLFIQGFIVYIIVTFTFLFAYRSYRDYRHEDGWRMSESLARHEQLQELHRMRQEMNERARQMQQTGDPEGFNRPLRANETAESRALEYARQRRIQTIQEQRQQQQMRNGDLPELRGWPKITEEQGRITKRAQDPAGVVFYEPTKDDSRQRQIRNQRRSDSSVSSWKARSNSSAEAERAAAESAPDNSSSGVSLDAALATAGAPPGLLGSHGTDPSRPLPQESNVGAVFASQVTNTAETRDALNKILGLVRKAKQEQEAEGK